jgi:zinc transport system substrate-binding protein
LRAKMTEGGILCAFPEAQHDPKMVQTLVEGTGVKLGTPLDPSGSSLEPGPGLYAALIAGLSDSLRACLAD